MKITLNKNNIGFSSIYNNKIMLGALEKISDHSASFSITASMLGALVLRPLAVNSTTSVKKDNKKYLTANSISSGLAKFLLAEAVAFPVENAVKKISGSPQKYLSKQAIDAYLEKNKNLIDSKNFKKASQILKTGTNFVFAIPKSLLTVALIPYIADKVLKFKNKIQSPDINLNNTLTEKEKDIYSKIKNNSPAFKGCALNITQGVFNNNLFQKFIKKSNLKEENIARNMSVLTDIVLSGSFAFHSFRSKKIDKDKKQTLIFNNAISTVLSILGGCTIDKFIKPGSKNFIDNLIKFNGDNPKLQKYIQGINVLRPTLIFAAVYYGIIPVISAIGAEKLNNAKQNSST